MLDEVLIIGQAPPPTVSRSDHYTIVCGGTWLNRKTFDQAVADGKRDNRVFQDLQNSLMVQQYRQNEVASNERRETLNVFQRLGQQLVRLPVIGNLIQGGVALFTSFTTQLAKLSERAARGAQTLASALAQLFMGPASTLANPSAKEGAIAQLLSFFFGPRRDAQGGRLVSEEEQKERDAFDFVKIIPEFFGTNKLGATQGGDLGGGSSQK